MSAAFRINGRDVGRDAFYAVACDPRRHVVVEACAGAGKTWMLVSRILRALLEGVAPQHILSITFTKKAAAEMRQRLDKELRELSQAQPQKRIDALLVRGCDLQQARTLEPVLATLYERVLLGGRGVEIRTFHSWFSQLLRAAPLAALQELGLHAQVALLEDVTELEPLVWKRLMRRLAAQPEARGDFERLIEEAGRVNTRGWLMQTLRCSAEFELADPVGGLDSVPPAHVLWPAYAGLDHPRQATMDASCERTLLELARELGAEGRGANLQKAARGLIDALAANDAPTRWSRLNEAVMTKSGTRRQLGESMLVNRVQAWVEDVQKAIEQQEAHERHERMVRLGRLLLQEYKALKRERGVADMADLERCALHLLKDATLSAWIQERLDARVRHVLIDEFQDTSPVQWHALQAWLSAYAGAGSAAPQAPSIFIVGDPKQSVYHFRGADPRVFVAAQQLVREGLGGDVLSSDHTRRNAPAIVDVLNTVFTTTPAPLPKLSVFRAHTTESASSGGVFFLPTVMREPKAKRVSADEGQATVRRDPLRQPRVQAEEALPEQEARLVAMAVQELLERGLPPGEIHVLSRKRRHLRLVASALLRRGIPYAAPEDSELMASPLVRDLVALLDAVVSPHHDLSLAHALRSPVFGAGDDDLMALAQRAHERGVTWTEALDAAATGELTVTLTRAQGLLQRWREAAQRLPPHDLLDDMVARGALHARYAAALPPHTRIEALEHLDALLGQALALDAGRYASPYSFVRALKQRAISVPIAPITQAVQLLTIHAAKGLEATAVFMVDTDPEAPRDGAGWLVEWPAQDAAPRRVAFVSSLARAPASLDGLVEAERGMREQEERNALYVAMTRSKQWLVLSATQAHSRGKSASWFSHLQPCAPTPWQARAVAFSGQAEPPEASPPSYYELPVRPSDSGASGEGGEPLSRAAQEGAGQVPGQESEDARARLGQAVHRVLEWATRLPMSQRPQAWLERAARRAAAALDLGADFGEQVLHISQRILHSAELASFFDNEALEWWGNEVPVSHEGTALRIDRLVCTHGSNGRLWWVLDYKTHHAPGELEGYRRQLTQYVQAVQALQPQDEVRGAFVTATGACVPL